MFAPALALGFGSAKIDVLRDRDVFQFRDQCLRKECRSLPPLSETPPLVAPP